MMKGCNNRMDPHHPMMMMHVVVIWYDMIVTNVMVTHCDMVIIHVMVTQYNMVITHMMITRCDTMSICDMIKLQVIIHASQYSSKSCHNSCKDVCF